MIRIVIQYFVVSIFDIVSCSSEFVTRDDVINSRLSEDAKRRHEWGIGKFRTCIHPILICYGYPDIATSSTLNRRPNTTGPQVHLHLRLPVPHAWYETAFKCTLSMHSRSCMYDQVLSYPGRYLQLRVMFTNIMRLSK
jgi:hypothetical protein